ncbi:MAG: ATP-binding cassette domain-containing protein, partial [Proteobacteria bacterium]|nr:ATP-binding cassette domain-containing protein [Pseudomonadota bacterium]
HGTGLKNTALNYLMAGKTFPEIQNMSVSSLRNWLDEYFQDHQPPAALQEAFTTIKKKLSYLCDIGLNYLTLARKIPSLSGGEIQRIRITKCLGGALTQTLYCLDEPTAGLHPHDSRKLLLVMRQLRDQGNTVIVVEHDPWIIQKSDYLIQLGPGAGTRGGEIIYQGPPHGCQHLKSSHPREISPKHPVRDRLNHKTVFCELTGVHTHNLKGVDVRIPLGKITGICGVSGSGKTSLIRHTVYPALCQKLGVDQKHQVTGTNYQSLSLSDGGDIQTMLTNIMLMSQKPLGRTTRSNISSYLGVLPTIRNLLASTESAKINGLTPSYFSFNSSLGRCETCSGLGVVIEDISFLGSVEILCPSCRGQRFNKQVLAVEYQGKNIHQILGLTIEEARIFFKRTPAIATKLQEVIDLGLGYLSLGQVTSTFSGGEAQRLKILKLLINTTSLKADKLFLIFDEPTGGLSETDIEYLSLKLQRLKQAGHTVVFIEHHLALLKSADWLIEIGPGAATAGGEVNYQGPPADIVHAPKSTINQFMFP